VLQGRSPKTSVLKKNWQHKVKVEAKVKIRSKPLPNLKGEETILS
jgi:hypothetical protein